MAIPDGPTDIDLWNDAAGRLVRLSVPTQSLDVVRADVATVAARREVAARPGDEIVRVPGNGFVLGATVSKPPGGAKTGSVKLPAVVLVGSSGSADRNETVARVPIFAQLAGSLADAGFLVVRYDKRGTGESGGRIETATISDYADDADAVVRYLEKRKDVDKKRIAMVANDDGVWTALLAASRSGRVAALGLIGGAGSTGAQVTLAQQQRALGRMSISDAEKLARVELQQKIQKAVVSGTGWEGVPPAMRKQADTPWFQSFLLFDPAKVVPRTRQPMLILRGALDTQVSMAEHEKLVALARARKDPAGKAVQAATLAGLNHLLVPATTGEVDEYASLGDRTVGARIDIHAGHVAEGHIRRARAQIAAGPVDIAAASLMWILKSNADAGVPRVTFRIADGTIKTIGRAPRAEFVHRRRHGVAPALPPDGIGEWRPGGAGPVQHERHVRERPARPPIRSRPRRSAQGRPRRVDRGAQVLTRDQRLPVRNGFVLRSWPIVVSGPWPGWTTVASRKRKQHVRDRADQRLVIAARQVRPPDRTAEQRVARKQQRPGLPPPADLEAHAARRVPGRVVRAHLVVPERDRRLIVIVVDGRRLIDRQAEEQPLLHGAHVEREAPAGGGGWTPRAPRGPWPRPRRDRRARASAGCAGC